MFPLPTFQFPIPLPDVTFSPFGEAAGSAGDGGQCIGVPFLFSALLLLIHHWFFNGPQCLTGTPSPFVSSLLIKQLLLYTFRFLRCLSHSALVFPHPSWISFLLLHFSCSAPARLLVPAWASFFQHLSCLCLGVSPCAWQLLPFLKYFQRGVLCSSDWF